MMMDLAQQKLPGSGFRRSGPKAHNEIIRWLIVAGFVVALVLLYAWNQVQILQVQYRIEELSRDNSRLEASNARLRAEYKLLTSPARITRKARELGLISSNQPQVTIIQAPARGPRDSRLLAAAREHRKVISE